MNESVTPFDLVKLRQWCGKKLKGRDDSHGFVRLEPNCPTKNDSARQTHWMYCPRILGDPRKFPHPSQLAQMIEPGTIHSIQLAADNAITQLVAEARNGNAKALRLLVATLSRGNHELKLLVKHQPKNARAAAEQVSVWPSNMRRNLEAAKRTVGGLNKLRLGSKAIFPTRRKQRIDPRNLWTRLAKQAGLACHLNIYLVRALLYHVRGAEEKRITRQFWGKKVTTSVYYLASGDFIVVADWQALCAELSEPVTDANFDLWWRAVRGCVLDHWYKNRREFRKAKHKIDSCGNLEDFDSRSKATTAVRQAFKSLMAQP